MRGTGGFKENRCAKSGGQMRTKVTICAMKENRESREEENEEKKRMESKSIQAGTKVCLKRK